MVNKTLSQKGSANVGIVVVLIVILLGTLGYVFWQKSNSPDPSNNPTPAQSEDPATSRDATRKKYAGQFASTLFSIYLLQGQTPSPSQEGLGSITTLEGGELAVDPLTNKPYVYNDAQSILKVGEAIFKVNATCDDKISGSDKAGLIVDGSKKSVAVSLKLESGEYACESNL